MSKSLYRTLPHFVLIVAMSTFSVAHSAPPQARLDDCPGDKFELDRCLGKARAKYESTLSNVYHLLVNELGSGSNIANFDFDGMRRTLINAQNAWMRFREAQCNAEVARFGAGSGAGQANQECIISLTNERINYLSAFATEIGPDSNLCIADKTKCIVPAP
jgi:uncharacterized protein YecT (DUF1311 family)